MKKVSGTINGTGAAIYVGIGFIPDKVTVYNTEASTSVFGVWHRDIRSLDALEGFLSAAAVTKCAYGAGIAPYRGRTVTASGNTAYLIPVEQTRTKLSRDMRDAYSATAPITTWTLGSSSNRTGNFNKEASTDYVGEGSAIIVQDPLTRVIYQAVVTAMTSNGEQANEVTLSEAVPSGDVQFLGPMYDYIAAPAGVVMPAGFVINSTTLSVSGELLTFEAESWT
jgi:hypothetical protein